MILHVNDTDYGADEVRAHRNQIIELRDEALRQNDFQWAVTLSITVALLYELVKLLDG